MNNPNRHVNIFFIKRQEELKIKRQEELKIKQETNSISVPIFKEYKSAAIA